MTAPYRPRDLRAISGDEVERFFENYVEEAATVPFDADQLAYLTDPKILGRVLDPATRPFFAYHVGANIARVVRTLLAGRESPALLELGCGSGSVALLLALGGARVVGVDLSEVAVGACRKRQAHYEAHFGKLALEFHAADVFDFPFADAGPLDGLYSVHAFNLMQPSGALLDRIVPALAPGGRLVIADGNQQSLVARLLSRRAWLTPGALRAAVRARGLSVRELRFGGLIPAPLARIAPVRWCAEAVERLLAPTGLLGWAAASFTLVAEQPRGGQTRG